jgi:hypothetical protein
MFPSLGPGLRIRGEGVGVPGHKRATPMHSLGANESSPSHRLTLKRAGFG